MRNIGFHSNLERQESFLGFNVGDYVVITNPGVQSSVGKIDKIGDGIFYLFPYQAVDYTSGKARSVIVEEGIPQLVMLTGGASITPTTRENIEAYCEVENSEGDDKSK